MTTYTEQFAGQTVGVIASNFTERTGATTNYTVENPADGEAESDRAFTQDGTAETAGTSMLSFDDVDGDANRDNCEVLARFRVAQDADQQIHFWARASGSAGNRTGYLLWFDAGTGPRWGRYVAESFTVKDGGANLDLDPSAWYRWGADQTPFNFTTFLDDVWLWVRWRINGTGATVSHSVRWWVDGQDEPTAWGREDTDTDGSRITAAGWTAWGRGEMTAATNTELDYFSVGTNGDTPAIAATLDSTVIRIGASQMSAVVNADDPVVRLGASQMSAPVNSDNPPLRITAAYKQVVYSYSPPITPQSGPVLTTNS